MRPILFFIALFIVSCNSSPPDISETVVPGDTTLLMEKIREIHMLNASSTMDSTIYLLSNPILTDVEILNSYKIVLIDSVRLCNRARTEPGFENSVNKSLYGIRRENITDSGYACTIEKTCMFDPVQLSFITGKKEEDCGFGYLCGFVTKFILKKDREGKWTITENGSYSR